jgi:replicative superfamily II helicase
MALFGLFIGINKFADSSIRELGGCVRDARGLWALFQDTILEMRSQLLVDAAATSKAIRESMDNSLGSAGPDDTVIVSFSGHGSPDHRLVTHDTERARLAETAIEMAEVARRFKESNAKAILCILDCCFSGEAPARVLDGVPVTRMAVSPLDLVTGSGRILIAASGANEPALEFERHGLLTRALIEALQSNSSPVSLTSLMDDVMQRVRADASRLGHVQTPVLLGHIQGGFTLPSLKKGVRFFQAFPESKGIHVSADLKKLADFALPSSVLEEWQRRYPQGLNDLQLSAVNDHRVLDGQSLLVVAPTSSGKTFIGEMAAAKAITEGRKAVFLFPYKALANEKFDQFAGLYGSKAGMRVIRCTGDYADQASLFVRGKYDLALLTYEMFLNLSVSHPATLDPMGLLVVDEVQFIADSRRGIAVELLLTHMLAARERGVSPQIIALSAVIGGLNDFDLWLGSAKLISDKRPIPLVEGVVGRSGIYRSVDSHGQESTIQLLPAHRIVQRREKASAQDIIVPLVQSILASQPGERVIIFRNARGPAEGCAKYLAQDLGLPPARAIIEQLPAMDMSSSSESLRQCLDGGTAFHTGDLNREERRVIEQAFRDPSGEVKVLAATTTVAAGINTPASTVILAEQKFFGEENQPFTIAEYKNMAGRAGRLGFKETGRAIILAETPSQEDILFQKYVLGKPETLTSSFDPNELETWILRLLAQVRKVPRNDAVRLLTSTFGGYISSKSNPGWQAAMADRLNKILDLMLKLELVEEELGFIKLTILGHACGRSSLGFTSAMRLVGTLKEVAASPIRAEDLVVLIQALPELDALYTPLMKKGTAEGKWPQEAQRLFGYALARGLQKQAATQLEYFARCKRAVTLKLWVNGVPIGTIERDMTINPYQGRIGSGDIRRFADATRFHLRPAFDIASVMLLANAPNEQAMDRLLTQLEFGLPEDCLDLLGLGLPLERGEYLALRSAGIKSADQVWQCSPLDLEKLFGKRRAEELRGAKP